MHVKAQRAYRNESVDSRVASDCGFQRAAARAAQRNRRCSITKANQQADDYIADLSRSGLEASENYWDAMAHLARSA